MYNNIVPNGLPLYDNELLLNYKKPWVKGGGGGQMAKLSYNSTTGDLFIPRLDFKRLIGGGGVDTFKLMAITENYTGTTEIEILATTGWDIQPLDDTYEALIRAQGAAAITQPVDNETPYQFLIISGAATYWSEVFFLAEASDDDDTIPGGDCDEAQWIKLYWSSEKIESATWHSEGGIYSMLLPVAIAQPTYANTKDSEENSSTTPNITYMYIKKRFQFFVVVPEYLADILNALPIFQDVNVQWADGSQMDIREIEVETTSEAADTLKVVFSFVAPNAYLFTRSLCA